MPKLSIRIFNKKQPLITVMELTYLVRAPDGKEYGPASLAELTSWVKEGRIAAQQEVRRSDMQYWAAAGAFTELKSVFNEAPFASAAGAGLNMGTGGVATQARLATASAPTQSGALIGQMRSGGSWFYWVAGLSLVNTFAALSGSDWRFAVGLGITQIFDAFGNQAGGGGKLIAFVLDLLAAGVFVGFGVFANKGHVWAFIVGMALFALDGLIFLLVKDWIGVAFHVFVLYCLFRGLAACRELTRA
jgi:hypothetical protein